MTKFVGWLGLRRCRSYCEYHVTSAYMNKKRERMALNTSGFAPKTGVSQPRMTRPATSGAPRTAKEANARMAKIK